MKCINATALVCKPKAKTTLSAHVSTFEDGSTAVLCTAKGSENPANKTENPDRCSITGKVCAFVRGRVDGLLKGSAPLSAAGTASSPDAAPDTPSASPKALWKVVDEAESKAIAEALERHKGDRDKAAEDLALSPDTLWRKMRRLGISYGCTGCPACERDVDMSFSGKKRSAANKPKP